MDDIVISSGILQHSGTKIHFPLVIAPGADVVWFRQTAKESAMSKTEGYAASTRNVHIVNNCLYIILMIKYTKKNQLCSLQQ